MTQSSQMAPPPGTGFGARLSQAREAACLSLEDVSRQLKMPVRVLAALESDTAGDPSTQVFVRGQLRSYARLLGVSLPAELESGGVSPAAAPALVSHTHTPRYRRMAEQVGRRAIYIVLTAAIAAPIWLATRPGAGSVSASVESLELPANLPAQGVAPTVAPASRMPLVASMTSLPAPSAPSLEIAFTADSWVEAFAPDGRVIERALVLGGDKRQYQPGELGRVVLGNASAVRVQRNGANVDLAPFQRANVARFALSSDGSLAPVAD